MLKLSQFGAERALQKVGQVLLEPSNFGFISESFSLKVEELIALEAGIVVPVFLNCCRVLYRDVRQRKVLAQNTNEELLGWG